MRKKFLSISMVAILSVTMLVGCGDNAVETSMEPTEVEEIEAETEETEETEAEAEAEAEAEETEETEEEIEEAEAEAEVEAEETEVSAKTADVEEVEEDEEVVVPVHTHNYALTASTAGTSCTNAGIDTYTCNCGDSYTVANNIYGTHTWTTETYSETIHHDAIMGAEYGYTCGCGVFHTFDDTHYLTCSYTNDVREYVVSAAYDEVVNHSRTYCTSCGAQQ